MGMELVATTTLAAPATELTITGLPQDGTELLFRWSVQSNTYAGQMTLEMRIITTNGIELTTNHNIVQVRFQDYGEARDDSLTYNSIEIAQMLTGNGLANSFSSGEIRFADYTLSIIEDPQALANAQSMTSSANLGSFFTASHNSSYAIGGLKIFPAGGELSTGSSLDVYKITNA